MSQLVLPDCSIESEKSKLWFISAVSNPAQWKSRYNLARKFRKHITEDLKANLVMVECALGNGGFHVTQGNPESEPDDMSVSHRTLENGARVIDIRVKNKSWTWLKENLQNIAVSKLPTSAKYLFFSDADIEFANRQIQEHIIYALGGTFKVVQPFETCCDLGNEGQVLQVHRSFGACHAKGMVWRPKLRKDSKGCTYGVYHEEEIPHENGPINNWHPGFCLAMTRETYGKLNGLLQTACCGAGDHHMVTSFIGRAEDSFPKTVHAGYRKSVMDWQARAADAVKGSFGYCHGTILHHFHGPKKNRKYISRWSIVTKNAYDPDRDIYFNTDGVMELLKPSLHNDIRRYFIERNEDDVNNE